MEVYLARQPIFDRQMNIYSYELLYRSSSENNYFEGIDAQQATAEVINNAFFINELDDLTDGTKAFINFTEQLLLDEAPLLLPKDKIVIEVLEDVQPTKEVIAVCKKLRDEGYTIALDDFTFDEKFIPLIELADIIKVEYPAVSIEKQRYFIDKYKKEHGIIFLAEKIETREQQQIALDLGYDLLQGYFYSKPVIVTGKEIGILDTSIFQIIQEIEKDEPDYRILTNIIERDLSLSYKLLKIVNSVGYGSRHRINSINQALVRLEIDEIKKWVYLLMLQEKRNVHNKELIKISLIRAKLMELMAFELKSSYDYSDFFLTGMFSSIDVLLNKDMEEIVETLPLVEHVEAALLGEDNELNQLLQIALLVEQGESEKIEENSLAKQLGKGKITSLYSHSLKWVMDMNY